MFRVRDGVKFGANRVCPMCNSGPVGAARFSDFGRPFESAGVRTPDRLLWPGLKQAQRGKRNDVGISGTPGRAGALRTNVRTGAGASGGVAGPTYECPGSCRAARSVLRQPAESRASGDGSANDQPGAGSREGIGAVGDGRDAPGQGEEGKLKLEK